MIFTIIAIPLSLAMVLSGVMLARNRTMAEKYKSLDADALAKTARGARGQSKLFAILLPIAPFPFVRLLVVGDEGIRGMMPGMIVLVLAGVFAVSWFFRGIARMAEDALKAKGEIPNKPDGAY